MTLRPGWLRRQLDRASRDYKQFPPTMRNEKSPTQHMRDVVESILADMTEQGLTATDRRELAKIGRLLISASKESRP